MRNGRERWMVHKPWDTGKQLSSIALSPSSAPGSGWQYKTLSWRKGRTQSQGCRHSSSFPTPHTLPNPLIPQFRKLTHNTQEQENVEPHGGLPPGSARKDEVSELTLPCALTPALFSLPPASPPPQATPSWFPPSHQVFNGLSPVQPVSLSLSAISRSTYLPALSSAGHLESHFSYCPPVTHDAPPDPFVSASWISVGWGCVEEDKEDRVGHGSNPAETLCS